MTFRVIQWATGGVGRAAIEGIVDHPELELVGCWVHNAAKAGRDAGEISGIAPLGVQATNDAEALLAMDADAILYAALLPDTDQVCRMLASGKNVVTPLGWFYPFDRADVSQVEAACREGGSSLHGTGIHPGGITERIPLTLSALSHNVTHVRAEEYSDIRTYAAPFVVGEIMLFGKTPEQSAASPMLSLLGNGFNQSIDMLAHALGMKLDPERRALHEMAVATQPIDSPIGTIEPGRVAAQRFSWEATVGGVAVISVRVNWLMGEGSLDPDWRFGPEGERFEIEVSGDPPVRVNVHGLHPASIADGLKRNPGIVATAQHCVNAIPYVCATEPGIKTYLDLPLVSGRAAPSLRG